MVPRYTCLILLALLLIGCGRSAPRSEPRALIRDAAATTGTLHGFHLDGVQQGLGPEVHVSGDVASDGNADVTFTSGESVVEYRITGGTAYVRGSEAWWHEQRGWAQDAHFIAGKWVQQSSRTSERMAQAIAAYGPSRLSRCLSALRQVGTEAATDRPAVVVRARGARPDALTLWIAKGGRPYVLRAREVDAVDMVGRVDPSCRHTVGRREDFRYSRFDAIPPIARPTEPIYGSPSLRHRPLT